MRGARERAIDLMRSAQFGTAIPFFLEVLKSDSNDFSVHYMLGQCYKFNGQLTEAIESLERSEELVRISESEERSQTVYLALGIACQENQEFERAVDAFLAGINLCPEAWRLHNSLGLTYKYMNNLRAAVNAYYAAQEIIVSVASKQHSETIKLEDGTSALHTDPEQIYLTLKSSPDYCTVLNNIGGIYLESGDLESARKAFEESIEFIPDGFDYPPPHIGLDEVNNRS
ncbi:MAG: tetratricopeptide repeat protein [Luminiphilus sp.]|nr:tetratricopeptide repeat protein [Luminiphilus sp.]